jgi:hypothetical protein
MNNRRNAVFFVVRFLSLKLPGVSGVVRAQKTGVSCRVKPQLSAAETDIMEEPI